MIDPRMFQGANSFAPIANRFAPPMNPPVAQQPMPGQPMPVGPIARPLMDPSGGAMQNPIAVSGQFQAPAQPIAVDGRPLQPGAPQQPMAANNYAQMFQQRRP